MEIAQGPRSAVASKYAAGWFTRDGVMPGDRGSQFAGPAEVFARAGTSICDSIRRPGRVPEWGWRSCARTSTTACAAARLVRPLHDGMSRLSITLCRWVVQRVSKGGADRSRHCSPATSYAADRSAFRRRTTNFHPESAPSSNLRSLQMRIRPAWNGPMHMRHAGRRVSDSRPCPTRCRWRSRARSRSWHARCAPKRATPCGTPGQ